MPKRFQQKNLPTKRLLRSPSAIRLPEELENQKRRMRIRIDKIYGCFLHPGFNKFELVARCYINGQLRFKRLFFNTREEADKVEEGLWIDY